MKLLAILALILSACILSPKQAGRDHKVHCNIEPDSTRVDSTGRRVDVWNCWPE